MSISANVAFRTGASLLGGALTGIGISTLTSAQSAAEDFGLPATSKETLAYIPVFGIRDLGFGLSILSLVAAESTGVIPPSNGKATAIATMAGAFVGLSDSLVVYHSGGKTTMKHAIGGFMMFVMALGIWITSGSIA